MNTQDFRAPFLIRRLDFEMNFKTARAEEGRIDKISPVRQPNHCTTRQKQTKKKKGKTCILKFSCAASAAEKKWSNLR
jgi:hypothetical protein